MPQGHMISFWIKYVLSLMLLILLVAGTGFCQHASGQSKADQGSTGKQDASSQAFINSLSAKERAWLKDHPVIRVAQDPGWAPIEFADEKGELIGMAGDYLTIIEQRLGLKFERVRGLSWQEAYARLQRWEIDMTTSVAETPERSGFWAFSKPYMRIPVVIVTHTEVTYIANLKELAGKRVAVVEGYAVNDWIPRDYPDIQLVRVNSVKDGLQALQQRRVFAFVDNMLVVGYYMARLKIMDLKIAGETSYVNAQSMAVRKDWAPLAGILDKALDSISEAERNEIYRKWLPIRYEHGFDYTLLWYVIAAFIPILLILLAWNRKLSREIMFRKEAEEAVRENSALFARISSQVPGMLYRFARKPDGTYSVPFSSDGIRDVFGCSPEEVRNTFEPVVKVVLPEDLDKLVQSIEESAKTLSPWMCEYRVQVPGRPVRWMFGNSIPEKMEDGTILWSGYNTDITERKQAETALIEAENRYHMLFDQSPDGILIIDPETGSFLDFNEAACRQLEYSREEFARLTLTDFLVDEKPEDIIKHQEKIMLEGRDDFDSQCRTRRSEIRIIHVTAQRAEISGRPVLHNVLRDITESRRLEAQLRHAQKLEGIGQLAGGIAHDFNNVLNAVIGYAELIRMHLGQDDPARHFADEITAAGMRGAALTRQILAFSRKQTLDMRPVNINDIVKNLRQMMRRLVREDITIDLKLSGSDLVVMADADQIDQVLINLTTNASAAMPEGGSINIVTDAFVMDESFVSVNGYGSPGKYALITFSDTGSGMNAETMSRIFDPFFTTKESGKGTGLGLAVVHGILKQHNGHINVYSEPGKGTVFNIYLPLTGAQPEKNIHDAQEKPGGGTETVLIAEDNESVRNMAATVLKNAGYKVIEAADGEDAIHKFSENSEIIGLAILDGVMPKKNGREAFEDISRLRPGTRAIFLSGYIDGGFDLDELSGMGAIFMQKPVKPTELLRKVREQLDAAQ